MADSLLFHWSKFMPVYYISRLLAYLKRRCDSSRWSQLLISKANIMDKKNTVTIRLTDEQFGRLRALSRRSKRSQSEVVRSLIEHGTVRERITRENLDIIRKLIGESTNLNQLARRANAYGFYRVADECSTAVQQISQLIKQLKDDR